MCWWEESIDRILKWAGMAPDMQGWTDTINNTDVDEEWRSCIYCKEAAVAPRFTLAQDKTDLRSQSTRTINTPSDRQDEFQLQHDRLNVNTAATDIASVLNDTCCLVFHYLLFLSSLCTFVRSEHIYRTSCPSVRALHTELGEHWANLIAVRGPH